MNVFHLLLSSKFASLPDSVFFFISLYAQLFIPFFINLSSLLFTHLIYLFFSFSISLIYSVLHLPICFSFNTLSTAWYFPSFTLNYLPLFIYLSLSLRIHYPPSTDSHLFVSVTVFLSSSIEFASSIDQFMFLHHLSSLIYLPWFYSFFPCLPPSSAALASPPKANFQASGSSRDPNYRPTLAISTTINPLSLINPVIKLSAIT